MISFAVRGLTHREPAAVPGPGRRPGSAANPRPAVTFPHGKDARVSTPSSTSSAGFEWTDLDRRTVDTVRLLAADAVQKVGNGHPGTAMSLAPAAYLLFQKLMRHDPTDPKWAGRDRFVLSPGHTSPDTRTSSCTCPATGSSCPTCRPSAPGAR